MSIKSCSTLVLVFSVACAHAGDDRSSRYEATALCSDAWYRSVDRRVSTDDGHGHGPDVGSDEWKSVVEFKLGIRDDPDVPSRDSEAWCSRVAQIVHNRAETAGPAFSCKEVETGSIEAIVCEDAELSALDRTLAGVYTAALKKAADEHPPTLKATQRGWIKGRNECWKSDDKRACIRESYGLRIAELQAQYRLVDATGPVRFTCDGDSANEVIVTFFRTQPPTLVAERGDSVSLMFLQPSASGAKYQGRNESFWEHQGEATIVWGYEAPEMHCKSPGESPPSPLTRSEACW